VPNTRQDHRNHSSEAPAPGPAGARSPDRGVPGAGPAAATLPSDIVTRLSVFDRFATRASEFVSRAWFFVLCVGLVVVWLPSFFALSNVDTWQLIINTVTTIVTFLLVALLQNTQKRADEAVQHKLNAIADALSDLMADLERDRPDLRGNSDELRKAVGLEDREGSD
jgi:hypothetical protein